VVATFNNGIIKLYKNGTLVSTSTVPRTYTVSATAIGIGSRYNGVQNLDGMLRNAVFYDGYAFTLSDVINYSNEILPSGGTFIYPFSEGAGTIAYDSSGNGNHGTITAGTFVKDTPTKVRNLFGGNLVYNGDFEFAPVVNVPTTTTLRAINGTALGGNATSSRLIFGWESNLTGVGSSVYFDNVNPLSGRYSMHCSTVTAGGNARATTYSTAVGFIENRISLTPGVSYTLSGKVKTIRNSGTTGTGVRIGLVMHNNNGNYNSQSYVFTNNDTVPTTSFSGTITPGSNVRYGSIYIGITGNDGNVTMDAWFDDITLTQTTPPTRSLV
jgi:hypothetical protein